MPAQPVVATQAVLRLKRMAHLSKFMVFATALSGKCDFQHPLLVVYIIEVPCDFSEVRDLSSNLKTLIISVSVAAQVLIF